MDLKKKIFISGFGLFLLGMIIVSLMSTVAIWQKTSRETEEFRAQEITRVKDELQNYVNIAYATVESNYALAGDPKYLEVRYGARLRSVIDIAEKMIADLQKQVESGEIPREEAQALALRQIKSIRYENGKGYIWVNDLTLPYPTMIMHPTVPALEGKTLDNSKYNCALGKNQNLFQAFVDQTEATGEGFVDYLWPKPTKGGLTSDQPKLSYVRRIPQWGWIIGTGIYVDDARADIITRIQSDLAKMRYADGTGYFWINDTSEPYPTMVMHPTVPALDGTVLDNPKYNCALGKKQNLFQAFVDQTEATGEGFVDYLWPKPTKDGLTADQPKLSFVRRFAPLGWIIGTGTYIDSIDITVQARKEATQAEIYSMVGKFFAAAVVLSLLAFITLHYMTRSIILPITRVIGDLGEGSSQVNLASSQIAASSQVLADNASSQAASLEETSASMEEMTAMNSLNAENTIQADMAMQEALQAVEEANTSMAILTTSMRDISVSSEETSKIVKTIDEIAFQTNLLALNAAVEAARAGEAGAGFAVVADEVRNLAMRAAEAAQSTSQMIAGTVEKIKHGEKIVHEASTSFTQVRERTQQVGKLVGEINIASQQQSQGLAQINIATSKMGGNVQNIAASAEESASVSHALNAQIQMLQQTIHNLVNLTGATMNISSDEDLPPENLTMLPMAQGHEPCWIETNCPPDRRDACPAYPDYGDKCWMITGTSCGGVTHKTLHEKMKACRSCKFYKTRVTG